MKPKVEAMLAATRPCLTINGRVWEWYVYPDVWALRRIGRVRLLPDGRYRPVIYCGETQRELPMQATMALALAAISASAT